MGCQVSLPSPDGSVQERGSGAEGLHQHCSFKILGPSIWQNILQWKQCWLFSGTKWFCCQQPQRCNTRVVIQDVLEVSSPPLRQRNLFFYSMLFLGFETFFQMALGGCFELHCWWCGGCCLCCSLIFLRGMAHSGKSSEKALENSREFSHSFSLTGIVCNQNGCGSLQKWWSSETLSTTQPLAHLITKCKRIWSCSCWCLKRIPSSFTLLNDNW